MMRIVVMGAMLVVAAGCAKEREAVGTPMAGGRSGTATLRTAAGAAAGRATVSEVAGGLRVTADVQGMPAGTHGIHIHTVGRCDAPDFTTAGPHWNPTSKQHGTQNPAGPHGGDLPNLTVGTDGRGTIGVTVPGATFEGLMDADGAAIIVHAAADDLRTDPSGNSGGRVACGVFQPA